LHHIGIEAALTRYNFTDKGNTTMQAENFDVYAQFLLDCKKVMGTLDFDRLANDSEYKAEVFSRISLSADDKIFEVANLVNQEFDDDESQSH